MSTAHRPTWDPAQAREVKGGSRQYSSRDMAAHTKLKFRQPGQTSTTDVAKRDLRAELQLAEHEARNKKRKAEGLPPLPFGGLISGDAPKGLVEAPPADDEANKRRKLLQEAMDLDRDDSDSDDSNSEEKRKDKGKARAMEGVEGEGDANGDAPSKSATKEDASDSSDEDDSDEDDDEDETAVLLRELEKIKRERAEEKARAEAAEAAGQAASREAQIATANPLLNLAAALGADTPAGVNTTVPGTFAVKRRWDDDLIFKNQAANNKDKSGQFVNDLLRTEFHRKFMSKFIK